MRQVGWFTGWPLALPTLINGGLGLALGALVGGLHGGQIGLSAGIALAFVPAATRWAGTWLARPDSLPRFVGREVAAVVIRIATSIAAAIGRVLSPIIALPQGPVLLARLAASVVAEAVRAALGLLGRALATPLGVANLAALIVIMLDLARFEFASLAVFVGFVILILTLMVSEGEARHDGSGRTIHRTDNPTIQGEQS